MGIFDRMGKVISSNLNSLLDKAEEEYRTYFKRPESTIDFWVAIKFEIAVGKFDLAALHLTSAGDWLIDAHSFASRSERSCHECTNVRLSNAGTRTRYEQPTRHSNLDSQELFNGLAHRNRVSRSARPRAKGQRRLLHVE